MLLEENNKKNSLSFGNLTFKIKVKVDVKCKFHARFELYTDPRQK